MDEFDQSNHIIEVNRNSVFAEEHIHDLAVEEIMNLTDFNSGDKPVTSTSINEQKRVIKAVNFKIDEEKVY